MSDLAGWETYYVIVGAAAGALVGLQFIVLTLIADRPTLRAPELAAAFATPTIFHFAAVLTVSAVVCAPWDTTTPAAALWGTLGLVGTAYTGLAVSRMRRQTAYKPVLEDWVFHVVLPLAGYVAFAGSAIWAFSQPSPALVAVAAASLLLLLVGIHNSWDAIVYSALVRPQEEGVE
ncbi:MAG: hypothetical protein ABR562_01740 [Thermoplasmatota archaeon]